MFYKVNQVNTCCVIAIERLSSGVWRCWARLFPPTLIHKQQLSVDEQSKIFAGHSSRSIGNSHLRESISPFRLESRAHPRLLVWTVINSWNLGSSLGVSPNFGISGPKNKQTREMVNFFHHLPQRHQLCGVLTPSIDQWKLLGHVYRMLIRFSEFGELLEVNRRLCSGRWETKPMFDPRHANQL